MQVGSFLLALKQAENGSGLILIPMTGKGNSPKQNFGLLVIFGSGETAPSGKSIHRKVLSRLSKKQNVAILETPCGFQPNSNLVAKDIADMFSYSLPEFTNEVRVIPARKKGTYYSPDNAKILQPLLNASYIFIGPGSPTYALKQLKNSRALELIINRWQNGATLCLSSAGALAAGEYTLPVYEIYKAGHDLHWKRGLNILNLIGLPLTLVTHWNNKEGGDKLDTSFCYMGAYRFQELRKLLPPSARIMGIDEHTAIIIDTKEGVFTIEGKGKVTLIKGKQKTIFDRQKWYKLESLRCNKRLETKAPAIIYEEQFTSPRQKKEKIAIEMLPKKLQLLLIKRRELRLKKNFAEADKIRIFFKKKGFEIRDIKNDTQIYKF